jgi:metal-responsive CopG/Arc/MetJ family transcriptional regulator
MTASQEGGMMGEQAKKRVERVLVMLDEDELRTLDTWRFEHRMPSRSAAIRELLRMGLGDFDGAEAQQGRKSESFGVLSGPDG